MKTRSCAPLALTILLLLSVGLPLRGNDQELTEEQRLKTRELIIVGEVKSKRVVKPRNAPFDAWCAVIKVEEILSDKQTVASKGSEILVYFDAVRPPHSGRNAVWPLLQPAKKYRLYMTLNQTEFSESKVPVIALPSDIVPLARPQANRVAGTDGVADGVVRGADGTA